MVDDFMTSTLLGVLGIGNHAIALSVIFLGKVYSAILRYNIMYKVAPVGERIRKFGENPKVHVLVLTR